MKKVKSDGLTPLYGIKDSDVEFYIQSALNDYLQKNPKPSFDTLDGYVHNLLDPVPQGNNMAAVMLREMGFAGWSYGECTTKIKLHVDRNGIVHAFPWTPE